MTPPAAPDPPLRDGELLLRRGTAADVPAIRAVYSEPDIRHWMVWEGPAPDDAEALANVEREAQAWRDGTWAVFRIVELPRDEVVGGASLRLGEHGIGEASYFLSARARGRGLATRAVRLLARWAFEELGLARVELRVHPDNLASQRVAHRAGFRREGIERASRASPDGARFDSVVYSLLPGEHRPAATRDASALSHPVAAELLHAPVVATLATFDAAGEPYLNAMWFAWEGGRFLFGTGATTRKVANVERDARGSVLVHDSRAGFDVVGLRANGRMRVVRGSAGAALVRRVHARYLTEAAWEIPSVRAFLEANDVALELVPEIGVAMGRARAAGEPRPPRRLGGYRPLAPTTPR